MEHGAGGPRAGGVEGIGRDDEQPGGLTPVLDVDGLAREGAGDRRRAVEGGEDEVAGVEEMRRAAAQRRGAANQRPRRGADPDAGLAEPLLERVGAMEAVRKAPFERAGAAAQFGEPLGETMGAGAQLFEAVLQPGGAAGKSPCAVFEARARLRRGVRERRAVRSRCRAMVLTLSRSAARTRASSRSCCAIPRSDGSLAGRRFEFVGKALSAAQSLVSQAGKESVEFDFQGQAGAGRRALAPGEARGTGREPFEGVARPRPAGGRAFERGGEHAGAGTGPFRADPEQSAAARGAREARPQLRDRGRGAPQVGAERGEPLGAVGPVGGEPLAEPAERPDGVAGSAPGRSPPARPGGRRDGAAPGRAGRAGPAS